MKMFLRCVVLVLFSALNAQISTSLAQDTAFTYQGRLDSEGVPVNGCYDLRFALYDAATGKALVAGPLTNSATEISNGLFTATLDFGEAFKGGGMWLELGVRAKGEDDFTTLVPRQALTPSPYAVMARSASNLSGALPASQISGILAQAQLPVEVVTNNEAGLRLSGTFTGDGLGVTNVNAALLNGFSASTFWRLDGNPVADGQFLGTTNSQALELRVNNVRALRLEPTGSTPNVIGGCSANSVNSGVGAFIGGGTNNSISANLAVIAGGARNSATNVYSSVGGGYANTAGGASATVAGGDSNAAEGAAAAVGGGRFNDAAGYRSTVAGGYANDSTNNYTSVGGGYMNVAGGYAATVPGGYLNAACGSYSLAAGYRAKATNDGAFVWGDSSNQDVTSTNNNSVTFRAAGGYRLFSNSGRTAGVYLAPGGSSWSTISDRNAKKNFAAVDDEAVLNKLAAIPLQHWNYLWEPDNATPNLGPMAQDFKAAFYPGRDDKSITTLEYDGVELAAIKGLNRKLDAEAARLRAENADLKARIERLERLLGEEDRVRDSR